MSCCASAREHEKKKAHQTSLLFPFLLTLPQVIVAESRDLGGDDDFGPVPLGEPGGNAAVRVARGLLRRRDGVNLGCVKPVHPVVEGVRQLLGGVLGVVLLASPGHGAEAAGCGVLFFFCFFGFWFSPENQEVSERGVAFFFFFFFSHVDLPFFLFSLSFSLSLSLFFSSFPAKNTITYS